MEECARKANRQRKDRGCPVPTSVSLVLLLRDICVYNVMHAWLHYVHTSQCMGHEEIGTLDKELGLAICSEIIQNVSIASLAQLVRASD